MESLCFSACVTVVANSAQITEGGELTTKDPPIHVQGLSSPQSCALASVFMGVCVFVFVRVSREGPVVG